MSVRAASSHNTAEPKYDMLVSSMTYIAHNSLVFYSCISHQRIEPGSDATVGERSNFKKIPTHTQDHGDAKQREGRVLSTYPHRLKAEALEQRD